MTTDENLSIIIKQTKMIHEEKTKLDLRRVFLNYTDLIPKSKMHVFPDKTSREVLSLAGTIPITYKGYIYNIPIALYLTKNHPYSSPYVYVTPTQNMKIKAYEYVDETGRIYLPYLKEWRFPQYNTTGLLAVLQLTFEEKCPVFEISGKNIVSNNQQKTENFKTSTERYVNVEQILDVESAKVYKAPTEAIPVDRKASLKSKLQGMTLDHQNKYSTKKQSFTILAKENHWLTNLQTAIGIDLGTSRCCAAVKRKNGISTVPLDNCGERLLPSYVAYDEENFICGKVVVNRLRNYSKSTIFDSKRIIGREYTDIEIDPTWPFKVIRTKDNQLCLEIENSKGKWQTSAEQVSAELLKHVKQKSEEFQGIKLQNVVITVPAAFTETQKEATLRAAKLAGWEKTYLLPEPVAAAFAYFVNRLIPNNSNVLVFDLGGGTMDVCIFKIQQNQIEIISNTGDTKLGGRDFDNVLTNYLKNELNVRYGISKLKDKKYKLMLESQKIKEDLSAVASCSLDIEDYDATKEGDIQITNVEFEQMTKHLLNKIRNTISSALFNSGKSVNEIAKVLQVGGGSRMPMVKNLLKEIFPNAEHCCEEHPDEVVAIGAAYYACSIFSSSELIPPTPPMRSKSIKY